MNHKCPYCNKAVNVCEDEDWDENGWNMQCPHCDREFTVEVEVSYDYEIVEYDD